MPDQERHDAVGSVLLSALCNLSMNAINVGESDVGNLDRTERRSNFPVYLTFVGSLRRRPLAGK